MQIMNVLITFECAMCVYVFNYVGNYVSQLVKMCPEILSKLVFAESKWEIVSIMLSHPNFGWKFCVKISSWP